MELAWAAIAFYMKYPLWIIGSTVLLVVWVWLRSLDDEDPIPEHYFDAHRTLPKPEPWSRDLDSVRPRIRVRDFVRALMQVFRLVFAFLNKMFRLLLGDFVMNLFQRTVFGLLRGWNNWSEGLIEWLDQDQAPAKVVNQKTSAHFKKSRRTKKSKVGKGKKSKAKVQRGPWSEPDLFSKDAHRVLGVALDADTHEIKGAFRKLIKKYHPDLAGDPGSPRWERAQEFTIMLNRAKSDLMSRRKTKKAS